MNPPEDWAEPETEYRECKQCDGTGLDDPWDEDAGDCAVCWGDGEVPVDTGRWP
jgi:hypothetical protein